MSDISWLRLSLHYGYIDAQGEVYKRVLEELGKAIEKSTSLANELETNQKLLPQEKDSIIDDGCLLIEYLLGTAFVLCQAYIVDVVSTVEKIHVRAKQSLGRDLKTIPVFNEKSKISRKDILRFGQTLPFSYEGDNFSPIQLINAFANYFKHRDEWDVNWEKLEGTQKDTAKVIQSVGAKFGCSGNLRQGSSALGNPEFTNTLIFFEKLQQWHIDLASAYDKELSSYDTVF
ncbi:hypothetical protein [Brasilonema bromeliae]|uniref:RiboL-PSP-HEPN domain-containing protein n=1 Tax=Brasilonema bromeliae SPC951 TaxID=385972 RepID=A0ABX1P381_9CYAN|nr:hypothetical protein [Brasilonema bromeliae]NMG18784.1 hypothetical protein [Brasilonema bromeliae SPC951]